MSDPLTAAERAAIQARAGIAASDSVRIAFERYEATLAAAEIKITDLKADNRGLTEARVLALRMRRELADQLAAAERERDQARADLKVLQTDLMVARQNEAVLETTVQETQAVILHHWKPRVAQAEARATRLAALEAAARAWDALYADDRGPGPQHRERLAIHDAVAALDTPPAEPS